MQKLFVVHKGFQFKRGLCDAGKERKKRENLKQTWSTNNLAGVTLAVSSEKVEFRWNLSLLPRVCYRKQSS